MSNQPLILEDYEVLRVPDIAKIYKKSEKVATAMFRANAKEWNAFKDDKAWGVYKIDFIEALNTERRTRKTAYRTREQYGNSLFVYSADSLNAMREYEEIVERYHSQRLSYKTIAEIFAVTDNCIFETGEVYYGQARNAFSQNAKRYLSEFFFVKAGEIYILLPSGSVKKIGVS